MNRFIAPTFTTSFKVTEDDRFAWEVCLHGRSVGKGESDGLVAARDAAQAMIKKLLGNKVL